LRSLSTATSASALRNFSARMSGLSVAAMIYPPPLRAQRRRNARGVSRQLFIPSISH
jgi:hypothetical protein